MKDAGSHLGSRLTRRAALRVDNTWPLSKVVLVAPAAVVVLLVR